jgi:hypothetical protein
MIQSDDLFMIYYYDSPVYTLSHSISEAAEAMSRNDVMSISY